MSLVLKPRFPAALTVCALLVSVSACGGRWRTITTTPDDDSADTGGAVGMAGAASGAGSNVGGSSVGGSSVGGSSVGGSSVGGSSVGGAGIACDAVPCPVIGCPVGFSPVIPAGQCCPVCQPVCPKACAACGPGTQAQAHPGACCPDCVPSTSCAAGQMVYEDVRSTASYKFSFGCSSDAECTVVWLANACEVGCGAVPLPTNSADSFSEYLKSEAAQDCAACPPPPVPSCLAPPAVHCYGGQCAFSPP